MRTSTAYFAGVGTVVAAIAAGLGGGYLAANVVSPHEPGVSRLERRMSEAQIAATSAPSESVPRIVATTTANPVASPSVATEPQQTPQTSAKPAPQITAANAAAAPAEEKTVANASRPVQPASARPAEPASDAFARARDADIKRAAVEKRRAERRARLEEKRRFRQPREQELEAVEERVREVTEPRQAFAAEPVRNESPRIRLFDLD